MNFQILDQYQTAPSISERNVAQKNLIVHIMAANNFEYLCQVSIYEIFRCILTQGYAEQLKYAVGHHAKFLNYGHDDFSIGLLRDISQHVVIY